VKKRSFRISGLRRGAGEQRGFTLLELLISISLLALIVVILGGAMSIGFRSIDAGERKMDALERYRTSFGILTAQLQSAAPLTFEEDGEKRYYLKGNGQSLRFATNRSIWGEDRGCVVVSYRLEAGEAGRLAIYASERPVGMEGAQEVRLFDDLKSLSFSYFAREAAEEKGEWTEEWSDDTRYPEQVRVQFTRGGGEAKILVPLYARAKK
jgi:general secretion pathway protein J